MKKLAMILLAASLSAFAADTTVKGYLVDLSCAAEDGQQPGFGAKHTKDCLQMPDCVKSGYGVLTEDKKVIRFDAAGNEQAKKFIAALTKKNDVKVSVTGTRNGDSMTVGKIELQ
jgi:phosphoribosylamine-glycine ligase